MYVISSSYHWRIIKQKVENVYKHFLKKKKKNAEELSNQESISSTKQ